MHFIKIFLLLILAVVLIIILMYNIPTNVQHVVNLAFQPKDLYEPIILDQFPFDEDGISKEYDIKPKYKDYYEIGIIDENCRIPSTYKFDGKIRLEIIQGNKSLFKKDIVAMEGGLYSEDDMSFYKKIVLTTFEIPSKNFKDGMIFKITVLKKDKEIELFIDKIKLYLAVSDRP